LRTGGEDVNTAFTEIIGPLATKYSISKAGEIETEAS